MTMQSGADTPPQSWLNMCSQPILEDEFDCLLVNARHGRQVPGRKTDVSDAAWLCQLLEAGLLARSFVPPKPIRALRNL